MIAILIFAVVAFCVVLVVLCEQPRNRTTQKVPDTTSLKQQQVKYTQDCYLVLNLPNAILVASKLKSILRELENDSHLIYKVNGECLTEINFCLHKPTRFSVYNNIGARMLLDYDYLKSEPVICEKQNHYYSVASEGQDAFNQLQDFLKNGELVKDLKATLKDKLNSEGWYKTTDGEYYINTKRILMFSGYFEKIVMYDFKTWSSNLDKDYIAEQLQDKELVMCEDPHKEHWQHFLHLEMLAKKKRQQECHRFVDRILVKQIEYNDLQLKYEMIPSAPIVDILTFNNFCKLVHEDVVFEDYEIQNYLLIKQQKL